MSDATHFVSVPLSDLFELRVRRDVAEASSTDDVVRKMRALALLAPKPAKLAERDALIVKAIGYVNRATVVMCDDYRDPNFDDAGQLDELLRARGALVRSMTSKEWRDKEYRDALAGIERDGGTTNGGAMAKALRQHVLELAWHDDNQDSSPGDFLVAETFAPGTKIDDLGMDVTA